MSLRSRGRSLFYCSLAAALLAAPARAVDGEGAYGAGATALGLGDYVEAEARFDEAVRADPALNDSVGRAWFEAGLLEFSLGQTERGVALMARGVAHDPDLSPRAGTALLSEAAKISDETVRARIASRALAWVGPEKVLAATVAWCTERWGPPRQVALDLPGWTELARVTPGDEIRVLSLHPFRQRDPGAVRIFPASVDRTLRFTFTAAEIGGEAGATALVGRHEMPVRLYVWLFPGK
jgi:tetratricopeptide (TPR) repeat protein